LLTDVAIAHGVRRFSARSHEISPMMMRVIERLRSQMRALIRNLDPRIVWPVTLDQREPAAQSFVAGMIRFCMHVVKTGVTCGGRQPAVSPPPADGSPEPTKNQTIAIAAPYPRLPNSVLRFAARVTT
jgi:hypothetical protein